jgi:hypothetical protein
VTAFRVGAVGIAVAAVLWLMLDSRLVTPVPGPRFMSLSLVALAALFGVGAWATSVGGQRERTPLLAGLALGAGGYGLVRLLFV